MRSILKDSQGMALVFVIFIVTILLTLIGASLLFSQLDLKITSHYKSGRVAFYTTEAGVSHAWQELDNGDGVNDFATVFSAVGTTVLFSNTSFSGGSYTVTGQGVVGSNPNRVKLASTGCFPAGCPSGSSKAVIEAEFIKEIGKAPKAVVTNGDFEISGNPQIMGSRGGAHSNDDMKVSGNPGVQMADGLTASNKPGGGGSLPEGMDISGNPCIGSSACSLPAGQQPDEYKLDTTGEKDAYEAGHNNAPQVTLPTINPADYAPKVAALGGSEPAYILHDDGTVTTGGTCGTNGLCTGGAPVAVPTGWQFEDGTWDVQVHIANNGIFYSETKIDITGSPGVSGNPWQATLIARDSIKISDNPDIRPYPTSSDDLKNHLLVTGNDLDIHGSPQADYAPGAILVHQQVKISGSPKINGFIIAGDGQPTWSGDPFPPSVSSSGVSKNEIGGNPTITYNGDFDCLGPACPAPVKMLTWREVF